MKVAFPGLAQAPFFSKQFKNLAGLVSDDIFAFGHGAD
jgi:hypothetical protein